VIVIATVKFAPLPRGVITNLPVEVADGVSQVAVPVAVILSVCPPKATE
jgi:hypothetical protein